MITKIELKGFKSYVDYTFELKTTNYIDRFE